MRVTTFFTSTSETRYTKIPEIASAVYLLSRQTAKPAAPFKKRTSPLRFWRVVQLYVVGILRADHHVPIFNQRDEHHAADAIAQRGE